MSTPSVPRDRTFDVRYEKFASSEYNPDLQRAGTLTVRADGQLFTFFGRARRFISQPKIELEYAPQDISDVVVDGRAIRFTTSKGMSGKKQQPFIFYCRHRLDADEIAALLPKNPPGTGRDQEIVDQLRRLAPSSHPLASITNLIVLANVVMFVVTLPLGARGIAVGDSTSPIPFVLSLANNGAATTAGEWWRLLTSMFVHRDLIHLLCNMWALFLAGHLLERLLGKPLFALVYLSTGILAGFASIGWYGDKVWSIGASGAVFGVYGALIACVATLRARHEISGTVLRGMQKSAVLFALYNVLYGMSRSGIDNAAHIGGLVSGLILGALAVLPIDLEARARAFRLRLPMTAAAVVALIVAGVLLAPRYDYRVHEELALGEFTTRFANEETAEAAKFSAAALEFNRKRIGIADYRLYTERLLAFYTAAAAKTEALELTRGLRTEQNRRKLLTIFEDKIAMLKVTGEMVESAHALERMEAELKRNLDLKLIRAKSYGVSEDSLQYARTELLPLFDEWEKKIEQVKLASPPGPKPGATPGSADVAVTMARQLADAKNRMLETLRTTRSAVSAGIRQDEAGLRLKLLAASMDKEFAALDSRHPGTDPDPQKQFEQHAAYLRGEVLPILAAWRGKFEAFPDESENLTAARRKLLTMLEEREATLKAKLIEIDAAHELITAAKEFDAENLAMLRRQPYASAANTAPDRLAPWNRWMTEEYFPFLDSWRRKSQAIKAPRGGAETMQASLLQLIDQTISRGRERLTAQAP